MKLTKALKREYRFEGIKRFFFYKWCDFKNFKFWLFHKPTVIK